MISVNQPLINGAKKFAPHYRLAELLEYLGNPQHQIKTINVVGTNGKGSTTTMLAENLMRHYPKVGWFISPAFLYHNERVRINQNLISDQELLKYLSDYYPLIQNYQLTFFEIWTLVMILYFRDQKVDIAVVEAGIGGMYDATKVFSNQLMVVLTSVSLDHTEVLGVSIQEILEQKLGIAYPRTPIFISADNLPYRDLVNQWSSAHPGHEIVWAPEVEDAIDYQKGNKGLVVAVSQHLSLSLPHFHHWPLGRFSVLQEQPFRLIIDGAHNEGGWERLLATLKKNQIHPQILFASASHKNFDLLLTKIRQSNLPFYVTSFDHAKAWDPTQLPSLRESWVDWKEFLCRPHKQDLVVCGSLYFIAQVYEWWHINH